MSDYAMKKHNDILKLIALYKENPCLWDPTETGTNLHDRKICYQKIAKQLCCSSEDVKYKLRNLRAQFRREVARQIRLDTKRPKWIYYNALSFLRPLIDVTNFSERNNVRSLRSKQQSDIEPEWESPIDEDTTETHFQTDESQFNSYEPETPTEQQAVEVENDSQVTSAHSLPAKRRSNAKRERVLVMPNTSEERDEFTIFGEYVANELRSLEQHKHLQKALKCSILQSILDANRVNNETEHEDEDVFTDEAFLEEYVT